MKEQELKEALGLIKALVKNVEGKIEALKIEKEDKFAELKEAHRNGAIIQFRYGDGQWEDCANNAPVWGSNVEYRIKPEEKPQPGDVCKFWDVYEDGYCVDVLVRNAKSNFPYQSKQRIWYKNAKKLTKQEATELLFGKEEDNV